MHIHIYIHTRIYICIYICIQVCVCMCIYIYIYIYILAFVAHTSKQHVCRTLTVYQPALCVFLLLSFVSDDINKRVISFQPTENE
jgi:hypothetical protein